MNEPLVSVIIPTFNSEKTLEKCLRRIKKQKYRNIEIIVVDNFSTDKTIKIAKRLKVKFFLKGNERSAQVNYGVEMSRGKYIYRIDSDHLVDLDVIEKAVEACDKYSYDAIVTRNIVDSNISFWAKVRLLEKNCLYEDEMKIAARFIKKSVFKKIGGFDENLVAAEDYDLHNRLLKGKYKIGRIDIGELHMDEPKSIIDVIKKHYFYGKTIGSFIEKNPKKALNQINPLRYTYLKHWRELLRDPTTTTGLIFYQTVRYSAALIGLLIGRLNFFKR